MKIIDVVCSKSVGGFYYDDQAAIRHGAKHDGSLYAGKPETPGFKAIRQPSEAISIMLILEDGQIAVGDCVAVQYSGSGGRDPLLSADRYVPFLEKYVVPKLVGRTLGTFREMADEFDNMIDPETGNTLHTALRYGITGALLDAVAKAGHETMAEVIAREYGTEIMDTLAPIYAQTGDDKYTNVDKMIIKQVDVLPHGLINNVEDKLGAHGEKLLEYITWIRDRIDQISPDPDYKPTLHFDTYGTLGLAFGEDNYKGIVEYLKKAKAAARGLDLRVEFPIDGGSREKTMEHFINLLAELKKENLDVGVVADEWCNNLDDIKLFIEKKAGTVLHIKMPDLGGVNNTIEAVLLCNKNGMGAYIGGSSAETDVSCRMSAHIAMATNPTQIVAKPGMGVDEGYMIIFNEMKRILALTKTGRED